MPDWLKGVLLFVAIVATIAGVIYLIERSEVDVDCYVRVGDMPAEMRPAIENAMSDGYISQREYRNLKWERGRIAVRKRIETP